MAVEDIENLAESKIGSIAALFSGSKAQRVAVLGAFDTWPYMDYVSRLLAERNYIVITSRWIYRKIGKKILRFDIKEHPSYGSSGLLSALLDQIISDCPNAVINFSVSAAHFIETDWCYNKGKRALGIAYVRSASNPFRASCSYLSVLDTPVGEYSECSAQTERTAWHCISEAGFCPFIEQGISKNLLEYFFRSNQMKIIAVENIRILPYIIKNEFREAVTLPMPANIPSGILVKRHESIFKKQVISLILTINNLLSKDIWNRASKLKLFALAETIIGVDTYKITDSKDIKSTEYIKMIDKGYVDEKVIFDNLAGESAHICCDELVRIGFLERKELVYMANQIAHLIRLSRLGKRFIRFLEKLQGIPL